MTIYESDALLRRMAAAYTRCVDNLLTLNVIGEDAVAPLLSIVKCTHVQLLAEVKQEEKKAQLASPDIKPHIVGVLMRGVPLTSSEIARRLVNEGMTLNGPKLRKKINDMLSKDAIFTKYQGNRYMLTKAVK